VARQQGFTLIELVMVIIVLAIISVTAASRFTTVNDQVTITPNYFLGFNLLGQPFNPQGERQCMTGSGCEITFTANNNNQAKMCINQQGYIHTGACL
jgi:prepilin-type N-terminal cleavage/methylation domain-containing protein